MASPLRRRPPRRPHGCSRPGAARTISDEVVEAVVVETLETAPPDATHWSTRSLAAKHGISRQTVSEIWRAFGLKPWRQDSFKVSPDPQLVEKIRDLVALYMNPPVAAVVFAVDEKPQIQALDRTAPTLPMLPTTPERATHDYERNGTCDLFAALNMATGTVITDIRSTHTSADFVAFLNKVNRNVPDGLDVHVILDNLSAHKTPLVHRWLLRHRRFHFHFTPTYGSWMNLVWVNRPWCSTGCSGLTVHQPGGVQVHADLERRLWRCAITVPQVCLDPRDAVELGEMLEFLSEWLVCHHSRLADSLRRFVGSDGYDIDQLRADLSRFGFLLGVTDGERRVDGDAR